MFDYIKCEMPLPETPEPPPLSEGMFQTKDTPDQYLTVYTITADGRLTWRPYRMEEVPKEERPHPNGEGLLGLMGCVRRVEQDPETVPFHGDIEFGTISLHKGQFTGGHWSYRARFTEGVCKEITLIEYAPTDSGRRAAIERSAPSTHPNSG